VKSWAREEIVRGLSRLWHGCEGQDLVEYALLVAFFGIAFVATWDAVASALGLTFTGTNADVQELWDPPAPGGSGP